MIPQRRKTILTRQLKQQMQIWTIWTSVENRSRVKIVYLLVYSFNPQCLSSSIPKYGLVVLSNAKSTRLSIGFTMNGIDPSPAVVGSHFEMSIGRPAVLPTANFEALTIMLMVKPGIATLAKDCHSKVSKLAIAALVSFDLSPLGLLFSSPSAM
mmetsp:Transcript_17887/g.41765  ORF Transcript_17887/g.41765 Transcript_17887/m.41765 type:complete len:154 (+) Transcript_17887:2428-2889(+)